LCDQENNKILEFFHPPKGFLYFPLCTHIWALFHFDVHLFFNLSAWASIVLSVRRLIQTRPADLALQRHLGELSATASASKYKAYLPPRPVIQPDSLVFYPWPVFVPAHLSAIRSWPSLMLAFYANTPRWAIVVASMGVFSALLMKFLNDFVSLHGQQQIEKRQFA